MWTQVLDFIFNVFNYIGEFWSWLNTPIEFGDFSFAPITAVCGGLFVVLIGASIYRLFHL